MTDWRDALGFEDLYQVALPDRVRSLDRTVWQRSRWGHPVANRHHGRELTPYVCDNGRKRVVLHDHAHRRHLRFVDDLIREAFGADAAGSEAA